MKFISLITAWRLKWYSFSILTGLILAFSILILSTDPIKLPRRIGGDFRCFYASGRLVATSGFKDLYHPSIACQKELIPDEEICFIPSPYPPLFAMICAPLCLLPYKISYILYFVIAIASFFIACIHLIKIFPELRDIFFPVVLFSFTFFPFLAAFCNGQLTPIIFMLFISTWRFTKEDRKYLAGFCMGLILFKPQFCIPLIGLFMLSGRFKIAVSAIVTGCLIFGISLLFSGIQPYVEWYHFLIDFVPSDAQLNGNHAVSWIGFLDAVFGTDNKTTFFIGYALCFATVFYISTIWAVGGTKSDFDAQMGLAAVSMVLIPPHVMYYDAGLIIATYASIYTKMQPHRFISACIIWLLGISQTFTGSMGITPIFFLVVITFFFSVSILTTPAISVP